MIASVITFLIYICLLAIVVYLIVWVLRDIVGLPIPAKVIQLIWVIVALISHPVPGRDGGWRRDPFVSPRSDSEPLPPAEPFHPNVCKGC